MENWITDFMSQHGYLAIFLLVALENIFPPIPSEIILTFGGFMTLTTNMTFMGVVLSATAGAVGGAIVLYGLGALLKKETIENILDGKIGKIFGFKRTDVDKAISWFNKHGAITVLFTRCIPVVRSLISIPAGTSRMHLVPFTLYTTIGTFLWNILMVWIGSAAGSGWHEAADNIDHFSSLFKYILLAIVILVIGFFIYKKRKQKN
ncbi:DedA family protein [Granulicatella sp. zg-ZJ]|uniref:DedA family protein n=1 Tax=unclassified Granulicatella TaxID=2630493 RepID=UPI0013C26A57|nr:MULTISPECIES: DedA family protein [unclassified Granulicatella]NEW61933.1 DedA family protein [Granulicatella sp. zg-ZJ]NEW65674.1 DedA family protein [Granulicatella sp. zg-84]QMI85685.1 DedA family protein [Carnobacteriaceae bacterium zg-84]